jgi:hypothetical protein
LENPSPAVPPLPILPKPFASAKAFNCDATFAPITTPFRIGERYVSFGKGSKAFLRVQPVNSHPSLTRAEAAEALVRSGIAVAPMGWRRLSPGESWRGPNKWGECSYMHDGKTIVTISQIMLTRELWAVLCDTVGKYAGQSIIAIDTIEEDCTEIIGRFLQAAQHILEIQPPFRIIGGLTGIEGCQIPRGVYNFSKPIFESKVVKEMEFNSYDVKWGTALTPFYEAIWDAAQMRRPPR